MAFPVAMAVGDHWLISDLVVEWQTGVCRYKSSYRRADGVRASWPEDPDFPNPGTYGYHFSSPNGCWGCRSALPEAWPPNPLHGLADLPDRRLIALLTEQLRALLPHTGNAILRPWDANAVRNFR